MFHFPAYPPRQFVVPSHDGWRVPPFGHPGIKALLAAPPGLSRPHTSFIGPVCQGIHHTPFTTTPQPHKRSRERRRPQRIHARRHIITLHDHKTIQATNPKKHSSSLKSQQHPRPESHRSCSRPLSSSQTTTHRPRHRPGRHQPSHGPRTGTNRTRTNPGVAVREPKSMPTPLPATPKDDETNDLFHTSNPTRPRPPRPRGTHRPADTDLNNSVERR